MKPFLLFAVLGLGVLVAPAAMPAAEARDAEIHIGLFYERLAPHGDWVVVQPYGWVWVPADVDLGWRPYLVGQWVWVHAIGWMWVSEEPYGWAVYHYGRWFYSEMYGWVWVPGTVWAPAWVEFRTGPGWIGWAPIPPPARWHHNVIDVSPSVGSSVWAWNFVPTRHFAETRIVTHVVQPVHVPQLLRVASHVVRPTASPQGVTITTLAKTEIERVRGTPIRTRRLRDASEPAQVEKQEVQEEEVPVFRPRVRPEPEAGGAKPPRSPRAVDPEDWTRRRQEMLERHLEQQRRAVEQPPARGEAPRDPTEAKGRQEEARRVLEAEQKRLKDLIERRRKTLEQPTPGQPGPRQQPPRGKPDDRKPDDRKPDDKKPDDKKPDDKKPDDKKPDDGKKPDRRQGEDEEEDDAA